MHSGGLPGIGRQTVGGDPRSRGPGTTYVGAECSPGNTAGPSAKAAPPCYSMPAGGAANKPACYSVPAGGAATKEASGERRDSQTPLQQSYSCSQSNHPGPRKATGQGMWWQGPVSQSPWVWVRDGSQCSLNYHPGSHPTSTMPSCKAPAL